MLQRKCHNKDVTTERSQQNGYNKTGHNEAVANKNVTTKRLQ